jgi:hypothetical protein
MELPQPFTIAGEQYYNSKDLAVYNPVFYYGCKSKPRTIIEKKKIPEKEYVYANLKSGEWNISNAECKKAQLLLSASWVDTHFFRKERETNTGEVKEITEPEIKEAPEIFFLREEAKFCDTEGNVMEIETRGERDRNKIFFRVKDVITAFQLPRLQDILVDKQTTYEKDIHYQYFFIRPDPSIIGNDTIKKELYLTYSGLLKVLISSRTGVAQKFKDWAEDKLFTIQMGNKEEKLECAADFLKISPKTIKSVFSKYAKELPCIYLLKLGLVSQLRETFKIDSSVSDEKCVYKYGFTKDFRRRIGEQESAYGKLPGVKIELTSFQMIDPQYTCKAEADIREECNAYEINLKTEGHNELIIMNETQMTRLKKNYGRIGKEYEGHSAQLKEEISKLKEEIKELENEIKTKELQFELQLQKEISEKVRYKTLCETNERIYKLEIQNRDLQLQAFNQLRV